MSEKEAWLYFARNTTRHNDEDSEFLCHRIEKLVYKQKINTDQGHSMLGKIKHWMKAVRGNEDSTIPPPMESDRDEYGCTIREALCRRMAHECEG